MVRLHQKQTAQRKPNVKDNTPLAKEAYKTVRVQGMEMLRDYCKLGFSVKKGDILGVLNSSDFRDIRLGGEGKVGWAPRSFCQETGEYIAVTIPFDIYLN